MTDLDGLAMLGQQRQKATTRKKTAPTPTASARRTLAPRHPAPTPAAVTTPSQAAGQEPSPSTPRSQQADSISPHLSAHTIDTPPPAPDPALVRSTIYFDESLDQWLHEVAALGRRVTPRVDVTRSAVVRFALQRLQEEMSAEETFAALAARASGTSSKGGRKRV